MLLYYPDKIILPMKYKTIGEVVEAAKKEHEAAGKKWTKEIELQVRRAHVQQLRDEGLLGPKTEEKPVMDDREEFKSKMIAVVYGVIGLLVVFYLVQVIMYDY